MINDVAAPLLFVSPGQINAVVPFITTQSVAEIQVINNNANSNIVTELTGTTSAGVFTVPAGGIYDAAAQDVTTNYSLVTQSNPAQAGDNVAVYVAGLGPITQADFPDGSAGPSNPPVYAVNEPQVWIADTAGNYVQATISYWGLAPYFAGLYQINFMVPTGLASGDATLEIFGLDSDAFEAGLPVGTPSSSSATPAARARSMGRRPLVQRRRLVRPGSNLGGNLSGNRVSLGRE